nr:MAG TPA: outer membrane protein [Caudoviricetes sp.]
MRTTLLLAGVAALFAVNANAAEIKPYVGLDYVYSMADIDKTDGMEAFEEDLNAFAISAGAKLHKNFGVEAFYQQSEEGEKKFSNCKTTNEYKAYGVDLIGYLPVGSDEKLELLGSVGAGYYDADVKVNVYNPPVQVSADDQGLGLRFGIGAQYNFTQNWGARVMARYVDTDIDGMDNMVDLTAGIRYTF